MYQDEITLFEPEDNTRVNGLMDFGRLTWASSVAHTFSKTEFYKDMKRIATLQPAEKIPETPASSPALTFYSQMLRNEQEWYLYFRQCFLEKKPVKAQDFGVHVLCDEILNGYHWTDPQEGMNLLRDLWELARTSGMEYYDSYFSSVCADFAAAHQPVQLKMAESYLRSLKIGRSTARLKEQAVDFDWLVSQHEDDDILQLSFGEILQLSMDSMVSRKLYKEKIPQVLEEKLPACIALADQWYQKNTDSRLLDLCDSPAETYTQTRFFAGAENSRIPEYNVQNRKFPQARLKIRRYLENSSFTEFMKALVRMCEAEIAASCHVKATSKADAALPDGLRKLIRTCLTKESGEPTVLQPAARSLKLDMDSIDALRQESASVRESLKVDTEEKREIEAQDLKKWVLALPRSLQSGLLELCHSDWNITHMDSKIADALNSASQLEFSVPLFDDRKIQDEYVRLPEVVGNLNLRPKEADVHPDSALTGFWTAAPSAWKEAIRAVALHDSARLEEVAMEQMSLPDMLVDDINQEALLELGKILIDTEEDPEISEDFREEIMRILAMDPEQESRTAA